MQAWSLLLLATKNISIQNTTILNMNRMCFENVINYLHLKQSIDGDCAGDSYLHAIFRTKLYMECRVSIFGMFVLY